MRFGLVIELRGAQLGLILTLRGLTDTFGRLDHEGYGELEAERRLADSPNLVFAEFYYLTRNAQLEAGKRPFTLGWPKQRKALGFF